MIEIKNFFNGEFRDGSGEKNNVISPWNGKVIATYRNSKNEDLIKQIDKIKKAQKEWSLVTMKRRSQIFYKYREIVLREMKKLNEINSLENGKLVGEAAAGWAKTVEIIEYAASMPNSIKTRVLTNVSNGVDAFEAKRPVGIVASITPFNFPSMVPHWTVPITIMSGNAMILKPSELTPISAQKMAEMLKEAGLPDGIFNIIHGGKDAVEAIIQNPDIEAITFVGSSRVAKIVYEGASKYHKKVLALGEAKNHILVTNDTEPQFVADNIIASAFGMSGQRCMAASVIVAIKDFHFKKELVDTLNKKVMGKDYGAIISKANLDKIKNYIEYAEKEGADILVDGRKVESYDKNGFWIGPTIIDWKDKKEKMKPEEIFGPVLEVVHAKNINEGILIQNESPYGNGAAIFTQNGRYAQLATRKLTAGMIGVNIGVPVPREPFSFGGIKNSLFGNGNITGDNLLNFVTNDIKVTQKWNIENQEDWMS